LNEWAFNSPKHLCLTYFYRQILIALSKFLLMNRIVFYLLILLVGNTAKAQAPSMQMTARQTGLPSFSITRVPDSSRFEKANLQKNKAVIMMVFSPDCEHCQQKIKEIMANIKLFKNVQIVMVSNLGYSYVKRFYQEFNVARYPNITMGMDYRYMLGNFFTIPGLPAMFLYNKNGQFVKAFDRNVPVQKIAATL
jgi:thioredoxin-related protein